MSNTVTIKGITINLKSGTVYASESALKQAGRTPNPKDKGIIAKYIDKKGEPKEYPSYSVMDSVPLEKVVKTSKVAKTATEKKFAAIDAALEQQGEALQAILAAIAKK